MADKSKIEWTDATWNPVVGCSVVSPGCTNCYVPPLLHRLSHNPNPKIAAPLAGLVERHKGKLRFTGKVALREDRLTWPLMWSQPRMIFLPSHGDLFHKDVPDWFIDRVFAVMAASPRHTLQVLTKRSARMRAYLTAPDVLARIIAALRAIDEATPPGRHSGDPNNRIGWDAWAASENLTLGNDRSSWPGWPLKNVWLGVSAEDQARADERIPDLLATPAAVRFVSAEPLLGPIDFRRVTMRDPKPPHLSYGYHPLIGAVDPWLEGQQVEDCADAANPRLSWIIVGGESGPGARPMHPDWARAIRDACATAGVAYFFKQHGEWIGVPDLRRLPSGGGPGFGAFDHCAYDQEHEAVRVGKKAAGRLLDGREHNDMPAIAAGRLP